jgi:hypothetical protein
MYVAVVLMATGFVNATKATKTPRRTRITAERNKTLLVSRLITFSNGTQWVNLWPKRARLGPRGVGLGWAPASSAAATATKLAGWSAHSRRAWKVGVRARQRHP